MMRAMRAESFTGYGGLKLVERPQPVVADGRGLVRMTVAGVTPPHAIRVAAWATMLPLLTSGTVKPVVESTYELEEAAEALRHLIEDRPFGKVVLAG